MAGEGSIFRRASDGAWIAQLSVGTPRRYVSRSARTKSEARLKLAELQASRGAVAPSRLTIGAYLERWVNDVRDIRDTTRDGYRAVVTYHLVPTIGDIRLVDLSPLDVERMLGILGERMGAKSLRNVHAVLRRALGQAYRAGTVTRNVASREFVDAPRVASTEPRALTADEVRRLLDVARADRHEALIAIAVGTGLRQGELLGLAWQDVTETEIIVRQALVKKAGRFQLDEPKTEGSKRAVPLPRSAWEAVQRHRQRLVAEGFVTVATGPVFVNARGRRLSGSWVTHHFYDLCERAGIDRLPFKNLRTTYGSQLYENGVPETEIALLMGHTRTHTTRRHYIARGQAGRQKAVDAIESLFANQSQNQSTKRGQVGSNVAR